MSKNDLVVVIGGGASGIIIAHTLKRRIGHQNFVVFERTEALGGTWSEKVNNYPGCGVDIPSHFYSFSFNQKPDWSHVFCRHNELSRYMNETVDKYQLRSHFQTRTEVEECDWNDDESLWSVKLRRVDTDIREEIQARIVISAVGALSVPKEMAINGLDSFQGRFWHSARWDQTYDWRNKRIGLIGNGCSATQIVPELLHGGVGSIVQFGQSPQWFMPRQDPAISKLVQLAYRKLPFLLALKRLWLFYKVDAESITLETSPKARRLANKIENVAIAHIKKVAHSSLHSAMIPQDLLGCKRRVMDGTNNGSYLASLKDPRMTLIPQRAARITEDSIISNDGTEFRIDALCFATGYKATEYLVPMKVRGKEGRLLDDVWLEDEGAHAYQSVSVSGFPNLALMFGPNSFPSNNSVIFKAETQAEYIERIVLKPILYERSCIALDVKRQVEAAWYQAIRHKLSTMVWSSGCGNWYINKWGHNTSTYPACALAFRRSLLLVAFTDYDVRSPNSSWYSYRRSDFFWYWPWAYITAFLCFVGEKLERALPLF